MGIENYEWLIGKTIEVTGLPGDPCEAKYLGKTGTVERIAEDCCGEIQLWGTWGGVAVYPAHDSYEVVPEGTAKRKYKIPVTWEMYGTVTVEAESPEDALRVFEETEDDLPLPDTMDQYYVDGSFRLSNDGKDEAIAMVRMINGEEKEGR